MPLIRDGLTWRIGIDPWIECGNAQRLPEELRTHLTIRGIPHFSHIVDNERSTFTQQAWKSWRVL